MRVLSVMGFAPYWGKTLSPNVLELEEGPTVGGGEEAAIRTAVGLSERGHDVVLYWYGAPGMWRGVEFRSTKAPLYPAIVGEKWDAVVSWSGLRPLEYVQPGAKRLFAQQLNDLGVQGDWNSVDCIVSPSRNHAEMVRQWGWLGPRAVVHNGLDLALYQPATPWHERGYDVGYWSSPDRGLHHLLRAWPLVVKQEPRARLHVFYEIKRYLAMVLGMPLSFFGHRGQELASLIVEAEGDKSVVFHGAVPRRKLARTQRHCRVQCYPFDTFAYCEGFAGAVNQGLAAGCLVMTTPKDALPSLYEGGVHWLKKDTIERDYPEWLAGQIVAGLRGELPEQEARIAAGPRIATKYTWDNAAQEMEAACKGEWF